MAIVSVRRLHEACDVTSSKRIYASELSRTGIPFYRTKDIIELLSGQEVPSSPLFITEKRFQEILNLSGAPSQGDVLLTSRGTLGVPYLVKESNRFHFADGNLTWFRNFRDLDSRYLVYYFLSPGGKAELSKCVIGSSQAAYTISSLKNIEISLPSLAVQRRISDILSAYDDLIENNQRRIKILEEMVRSLYREWFVHFRFPGHDKVKMVPSSLGSIPQGWEVQKLGEILELNYGKALKQEDRNEGSVAVFGSSGVVGFHDSALVKGPGIIVGRKGNVGSVFWSDNDFYPIDTVYYVSSSFPLRFLFYDLQTKNFINNDAAVPGLNRNQAYSLRTIVPSKGVLGRFCALADQFEATASVLRRQCENLRCTRDLLLPRLLSGQVEIKVL